MSDIIVNTNPPIKAGFVISFSYRQKMKQLKLEEK